MQLMDNQPELVVSVVKVSDKNSFMHIIHILKCDTEDSP
jgi:hypothetical protein